MKMYKLSKIFEREVDPQDLIANLSFKINLKLVLIDNYELVNELY